MDQFREFLKFQIEQIQNRDFHIQLVNLHIDFVTSLTTQMLRRTSDENAYLYSLKEINIQNIFFLKLSVELFLSCITFADVQIKFI